MWFKGVLTSEKLKTPIDSELLIYCLQADYILSCIWVYSLKLLCSSWTIPLLLSTVDMTSTVSVASLYTVDATACLSVMLLFPVVATQQPLDVSLWFVYMSVPVLMTHCSVVSVTSHSGTCLALV
jgi:hypothetical protein